ncbi:MAG: hypothetical protein LAO05_14160 [Acidobacteriia bacterium]|nr:hypothetical protein [Terriglobia bacterium]
MDALYHLALGTPAEKRKPLVWIRSGHALANRLDEAPLSLVRLSNDVG